MPASKTETKGLYLPTCPRCGYVVSEGQKEPKRCPGCGWDVAYGTTYIQDRADFDAPGVGSMSPPHIVDAAEEVKRGTSS